jgi:hypothetical protein
MEARGCPLLLGDGTSRPWFLCAQNENDPEKSVKIPNAENGGQAELKRLNNIIMLLFSIVSLPIMNVWIVHYCRQK